MFNTILKTAACGFLALAAGQASAASFTLDFGNITSRAFDNAAGNTINYGVVANDGVNDIYGQLTTFNAFRSPNDRNNGSASGDVRVNAARGETVQLGLSLFLDPGYSVGYTNASDYSWMLTFYDVDGISDTVGFYGADANEFNYYDEVLVRSAGVATFTEDTLLNYSLTDDGLLVNAYGQGSVAGQDGITSLTNEQQQYAFSFTLTNTSTLLFDYTVEDVDFDGNARQRNLLVDGGSLELTNSPFDVQTAAVPLPAGAPLLLGGLGAMAMVRRRRRK